MTALSQNISTNEREAVFRRLAVKDEEIMYAGGMAAISTSTGEVEMASDSAGLAVVGRVEEYVDNSEDGKYCTVKTGCFLFANSATHAVTHASVGACCFVEDDNTVSNNAGSHSIVAGTVFEVCADGVWVHMAPYIAPAPAAE